jgi:hypothetical protein
VITALGYVFNKRQSSDMVGADLFSNLWSFGFCVSVSRALDGFDIPLANAFSSTPNIPSNILQTQQTM